MNKILRVFLYVFFVLLISSSFALLVVSAETTGHIDSGNTEEIKIIFTIEIVADSGTEYYLGSLARRYGTTEEIIKELNGLTSDSIIAGRPYRVPLHPQQGVQISANNFSQKITATVVSGSVDESEIDILWDIPRELREYIDIVRESKTAITITSSFSNDTSIDDVSFFISVLYGNIRVERSVVRVNFTAPTVEFNPKRAKITEDTREAKIVVEGTAKGLITIDFSAGLKHLQGYITVHLAHDTIVINAIGSLPADWDDQMKRTSFDIVVKRNGVEAILKVDVDFTANQNIVDNEEVTTTDSKPPEDDIEKTTRNDPKPPEDGSKPIEPIDIGFWGIIVGILIVVVINSIIVWWCLVKRHKQDGTVQDADDITRGEPEIPQKVGVEKRFKSSAKVSDDQKSITLETTANKR
jgi:LysM repeat protein